MKLACFGGSFNPPTKGHIRLSNYLITKNIVDEVLLMPCYTSLYGKVMESGEHRLKMIELAEKHPKVKAFDWEIRNKIDNPGTYVIMSMLEEEFKGHDLYFVVGLDNAQKMRGWYNGLKIINEKKCIVIPRSGTTCFDEWYKNHPHIYMSSYIPDDISSSSAKKLLIEGGNLDNHLDANVKDYIMKMNLYKEHLNAGVGKQ